MMAWALGVLTALLLAGPLRRPFLAAWRFTLPAIAGFVFAAVLLKTVMKMTLPSPMVLGICVFAALEAGVIGLEIFGSGKRR